MLVQIFEDIIMSIIEIYSFKDLAMPVSRAVAMCTVSGSQ